MRTASIAELLGRTIVSATGLEKDSREVTFTTADGFTWRMFHEQDCCENVSIADVIGDPADLLARPLVLAEAAVSDATADQFAAEHYFESGTWTFYRLATELGHVDIRWLGESNGYYAEGVDIKTDAPRPN